MVAANKLNWVGLEDTKLLYELMLTLAARKPVFYNLWFTCGEGSQMKQKLDYVTR